MFRLNKRGQPPVKRRRPTCPPVPRLMRACLRLPDSHCLLVQAVLPWTPLAWWSWHATYVRGHFEPMFDPKSGTIVPQVNDYS